MQPISEAVFFSKCTQGLYSKFNPIVEGLLSRPIHIRPSYHHSISRCTPYPQELILHAWQMKNWKKSFDQEQTNDSIRFICHTYPLQAAQRTFLFSFSLDTFPLCRSSSVTLKQSDLDNMLLSIFYQILLQGLNARNSH